MADLVAKLPEEDREKMRITKDYTLITRLQDRSYFARCLACSQGSCTFPTSGVYVLWAHDDLFKIGLSKNIAERMVDLTCAYPLKLLCVIETDDLGWVEKFIHARLQTKRVDREHFRLYPEDVFWLIELSRSGKVHSPRSITEQQQFLDLP